MEQTALKNIPNLRGGTEPDHSGRNVISANFRSATFPELGRITPSDLLDRGASAASPDELVAAGRRQNFSQLFAQYGQLSDVVAVRPDTFFMFVKGEAGLRVYLSEGEQPVRQATRADVGEPRIAKLLSERFTSLRAA